MKNTGGAVLAAALAVFLHAAQAQAQTTETFETETANATSFTDNGQVFNITSQLSGPFDIQTSYPGTGWSGSAADNRYIDNDGFAIGGVGTGFTISSQGGAAFNVKSLYLYLSNSSANVNVSGSLTIVGKRSGVTQFTVSATSPFNTTSLAVNNGFTKIDFATFGGSNNASTAIDQIVITTTNSFNYVALDAFTWALAAAPPTATNLSAAEAYTEDAPLNLIDIVASDVDSPSVTATLTLSNPSAGSLSTATSGAVTSTYVAGTGVWTASGAIANVNALLAGVTFTPSANFNGSFTMATSVSDGTASVTGSKVMSGIAINDAPTATNLSAPESYTEDTSLNLIDIVASDVDSATVTATLTLSTPAAGSLSTATSGAVTSTYVAGTGVWTASGAIASVNALLAGVSFTPATNFNGNFTIATNISDGALAVSGSKALTGVAVNDAPTATNLSAGEAYTEDTSLNLVDIVTTDVDSATITATLTLSNPAAGSLSTATSGAVTSTYVAGTGVWTASGALADVNTLLAGVTFVPALNFNNSLSIATSISDGALSVTGLKPFFGIAVNDAPTATNLSAAETYTEDTTLNLVDIVASDVDSASVTATLTLSNPAAGSLSTATSGAVTSTYVAGTGVWTASGATANVNALLAGVAFTPAANFSGNFTVATSVSDGALAATGSKAFTGIAVNDPPTATNLSAAETYTEDTTLNLIDIVAGDVDSATLTATLTLSNPAAGSLSTATSGAVTSTYVVGTGVWSASGALADVNTLLAGVTFVPAANFNGSLTVATSVSDGALSATGSKAVNGVAVNDPPTATNLSAAEAYTEDTSLNLIDIVAGDVDSATLTATLTLSNPAAGSLSTATSGAVTSTYVAGTGVWSASGALADVNALLAGVTFVPVANFNGSFTITTSVSDGALAATGSKAVTGVAVNDPPTATNLSVGETYTEDTTLNLVDIVASDVDSATVTATLTLSIPAAGSLSTATSGVVTSTYVAGTGVWSASGALADVNALLAGVTFVPAANFNGSFTIATSVTDGVAAAINGTKALTGMAVTDCNPDPCQNGGACSDVTSGFTCACSPGYSGATCATNIDDCSPNPCANGGACADGVNSFTCTCAAGYSGSTCATNVDDCAAAPCLNGGTCADGVNTYTCTCAAGFMGARCDLNVNDCSPNPCKNGGTCSDGVNAFTCQCATGFTGATCEGVDACAANPCANGGACTGADAGYSCTCAAGYKGAGCETNINDCDPNPCLYGGACSDKVNGFACACQPGFSGATCGSNIDECASSPCQNGGTCADDTNGFVCTCADGFAGATCADAAETGTPGDDGQKQSSRGCSSTPYELSALLLGLRFVRRRRRMTYQR